MNDTFLYTSDEAVPADAAALILAGWEALLTDATRPVPDRLALVAGSLEALVASYRAPTDDASWVARALQAAPARPITPAWMYPRQLEPLGVTLSLTVTLAARHVFETGPLERPDVERYFLHKDLEPYTTRFEVPPLAMTRFLMSCFARQERLAEEGLASLVHFLLLAHATVRFAATAIALADGREAATREDDVQNAMTGFTTALGFGMIDQALRGDPAMLACYRDPATRSRLVGLLY